MHSLRLCALGLLLASLFCQPVAAQAPDPTFTPPSSLYAPAAVFSMGAQQADGKRVITGSFSRVNNTSVGGVARLDAGGALDLAFAQNVGVSSNTAFVKSLPNGQYLVGNSFNTLVTAGGLTRNGLVRLNANGTADASFDVGAGVGSTSNEMGRVATFIGQPDGKVLVGGVFPSFNGQLTSGLVRLNANGTPDAAFTANLGTGFTGGVFTIALQPDGKILVGGNFSLLNGQLANSLVRLNANGTRDTSFTPALYSYSNVRTLLLQPDGKVLATGVLGFGAINTGIVRLTATGSVDTGFTAPAFTLDNGGTFFDTNALLQPDGKIILSISSAANGAAKLVRLQPNGAQDTSFAMVNGPDDSPEAIDHGRWQPTDRRQL